MNKSSSDAAKIANDTLAAISRQADTMDRQANESRDAAAQTTAIAKEAAEAALLNAKAVLDAERPWFVPIMERYDDQTHGTLYRVRITNRGRTPGQLFRIDSASLWAEDPYKLPTPPNYDAPCYAPDSNFVANGDSFTDRERLPGISPQWTLDNPVPARGQADFLILYGRVVYKDTFTGGDANEKVHETRWCYMWNPDRQIFTPCGPQEYNGYRYRQQWRPAN